MLVEMSLRMSVETRDVIRVCPVFWPGACLSVARGPSVSIFLVEMSVRMSVEISLGCPVLIAWGLSVSSLRPIRVLIPAQRSAAAVPTVEGDNTA